MSTLRTFSRVQALNLFYHYWWDPSHLILEAERRGIYNLFPTVGQAQIKANGGSLAVRLATGGLAVFIYDPLLKDWYSFDDFGPFKHDQLLEFALDQQAGLSVFVEPVYQAADLWTIYFENYPASSTDMRVVRELANVIPTAVNDRQCRDQAGVTVTTAHGAEDFEHWNHGFTRFSDSLRFTLPQFVRYCMA